jgi:7,8-dihydropterin-6-yl-methyl-4-(beta-D-ribofuranosyl)aminobenzene 5'-phosphate synthase
VNLDICITILIDNAVSKANLIGEHGLSLWIEYEDKKILFDTGQSNLLIQNAEKLGIDLSGTDAIVLSHGHYDHTGGLQSVLELAPSAVIYSHPAAVESRYGCKWFNVRSIGMLDTAKRAIKNHKVIRTEKPVQVCKGVRVTGQIPRKNDFEDVGGAFFIDEKCRKPDNFLDDQALFIESPEGVIVVSGCAHSGIINTLVCISQLLNQSKIYAVIGGMHLVDADAPRIEKTISIFKKYDVQKIVPLHCTGREATEKIKEEFAERCLLLGTGDKICF